jgi:hypothetical protein
MELFLKLPLPNLALFVSIALMFIYLTIALFFPERFL